MTKYGWRHYHFAVRRGFDVCIWITWPFVSFPPAEWSWGFAAFGYWLRHDIMWRMNLLMAAYRGEVP